MTFVKQHFKYLLQIVLIGTKADLKYNCEDPITNESGERLAREIQAVGYVETSAKTGEGVHKAIQMGIKAVLKEEDTKSEKIELLDVLCFSCFSRTTKPNKYN